jgi:hypothetical protein
MNPEGNKNAAAQKGGENDFHLRALLAKLRKQVQSLADGGQRFHSTFDMLDPKDSGEIFGLPAVKAGLESIGLQEVTNRDAESKQLLPIFLSFRLPFPYVFI